MLCNTIHLFYVAVCLLVVGAIEYESIQLTCVALEIVEGLAWRRFEVLVFFLFEICCLGHCLFLRVYEVLTRCPLTCWMFSLVEVLGLVFPY